MIDRGYHQELELRVTGESGCPALAGHTVATSSTFFEVAGDSLSVASIDSARLPRP